MAVERIDPVTGLPMSRDPIHEPVSGPGMDKTIHPQMESNDGQHVQEPGEIVKDSGQRQRTFDPRSDALKPAKG